MEVESSTPILVERPMYFKYSQGRSGGHCVTGVNAALQKWHFAEGCTRDGFETWFRIGNPNPQEAQVNLSFLDETGRDIKKPFLIPAKASFSLHANDAIADGHDISTIVPSDLNVVVERPLYFLFSPRSFWSCFNQSWLVLHARTSRSTW